MQTGRPLLSLVSLVVAAGALGCASNVDVVEAITPREAAMASRSQMTPVAVVRGQEHIPIPASARLEADRVILAGTHVHKLGPNDVIEKDEQGRIVAVRSGGTPPVEVRFVPGTATSPEDSDEVRGQLASGASEIKLLPGDRIEMKGNFAPDDKVPGVGHVESRRNTSLLVTGAVILGLSYLPTAYVGLQSGRSEDKVLLAPVIGPFIDLAGRAGCVAPAGAAQMIGVDPCLPETASRIALYISGGLQALGFVIGAFGLPVKSELVYEKDRATHAKRDKPTFTVIPFSDAHGGGAAAVGTF